ncbi:MAG: LLM class F420-dependent oxidoreductase [Acidimicrobiia bacterium]|nr:LLM class F420-dependent oxidoreductase [Acidimicrobiia bacterium]
MAVDLGAYGVWRRARELTTDFARQVEDLGYGTLWVGGSPPADLRIVEELLDATDSLVVATGIVNMWMADADEVAASYHRVAARHPGRFLLGLGIGHPEAIDRYRRPYETMVAYLERLDAAGVPREALVLAALGPKVLRLSAERTAGAHPYLTTPRHTRMAREILGAGPLLAPEQKVILVTDPDEGRRIGREAVGYSYLRLVNYRRSLLREGWTEADLDGGGSDRLIDALVLHGAPQEVTEGLSAHLDAGADHVSVHALGDDPMATLRPLAAELGLKDR